MQLCLFAMVMAAVFALPAVNDESIIAVPADDVVMSEAVNPEDPQGIHGLWLLKKKLLLLG